MESRCHNCQKTLELSNRIAKLEKLVGFISDHGGDFPAELVQFAKELMGGKGNGRLVEGHGASVGR